ncbi:MFS transporter [Streptomyces cavernicola]|uniref:MFS transporter n=1 Tax=Streptomyces cavernicola TaxID=3043613 RepID=A0ABT6S549_9ACTN|nr:MFS transporter [Streptomyces sp. B-S-A6]MDI3403210.1 MFS transporter [Streptomyces sp. B-S-A6]
MSIREIIDHAPVSRFQVGVVAICLVMIMIDGFDILVMAFTASGVAREWSLNESQIGLLLSSGLVGMALGSALIAPQADRVGRRPLTIACLTFSGIGMALAAFAAGPVWLAGARLLTGLGIGGMVASLPVLVAEYSPSRRRGTAVTLCTMGFPLGGVLGGAVSTLLANEYGWRGPFVCGAIVTGLMTVVISLWLPESVDYLVARRPAGALGRVNSLLARMGHAPVAALPTANERPERGARADMVGGRNGAKTALVWLAFFVLMAAFYFATSWTPRLLEQSGLSAEQGMSGGGLLNVGGVIATIAFGLLALRVAVRPLTAASFGVIAVAFVTTGIALGHGPAATLAAAAAVGLAIQAGISGMFAIVPDLYPATVRTTAMGLAVAAGRVGGILSPVLVGALLDRQWTPANLFVLFAVLTALAIPAVLVLKRFSGHEDEVSGTRREPVG